MFNSLFLLNLIGTSRLIVVKHPFNSHFKSHKIIIRYLGTGLICSGISSLVIVYSYQAIEHSILMPSSFCLFLGETIKSVTVKFATTVMVILQIGSFISITILYLLVWKELKKSYFIISQSPSIDKHVLVQSFLVTITNALCWLPSSTILYHFCCIGNLSELLIWNAILINTVNSVINPIVFCIAPTTKNLYKR